MVAQEFRRLGGVAAIVVDPVFEGVEGLEVAVDVAVMAIHRGKTIAVGALLDLAAELKAGQELDVGDDLTGEVGVAGGEADDEGRELVGADAADGVAVLHMAHLVSEHHRQGVLARQALDEALVDDDVRRRASRRR